MNLAHLSDRAARIERDVAVFCRNGETLEDLARQVGFLADIVADLCDDLTPGTPPAGEWRRGMWLKDASRWYLLMEQDDDETWWAARFDSVGIVSNKLSTLMPNSPDYQRCEAPGWWA